MKVRLLHPTEVEEWNKFVEGHSLGSVEQSWAWGGVQTCVPGRTAFRVLGVFDEERGSALPKLVGGMLVIRQHMGLGKTWLWCPKGPLLPEKGSGAAWRALEKACRELGERDVFLRVESCREDALIRGVEVKTRYIPENTLILDLSHSEEKLFEQMSQSTRRNIRLAEKAGVKVVKGGQEDVGDFYSILKDTAKRDGFHGHEEKFYKRLLELVGKRATLWLAKLDGQVVGGAFMVHFADTVTYYFGASSSEARKVKVGNALQWKAIYEAKRAGAKFYDFFGISPEGALTDRLAKVTQFKLGFGGRRVVYQKSQVFVYRPFWWGLYSLVKRFLA